MVVPIIVAGDRVVKDKDVVVPIMVAEDRIVKDKDVVVLIMVAEDTVGVIIIDIMLLEGIETKEVWFELLSMVGPIFEATSVLEVTLEGTVSTGVEKEEISILGTVIVAKELISLLKIATVEGAATLEYMVIVLQLERLSPLKERIGVTVGVALLSAYLLLSVEIKVISLLELKSR